MMSLQESIALQNPLLARAAEPNGLFAPYRLGDLDLSNRLVMSPMTRSRAVDGNVPNPLAPTYYAQRASAGLIVTEATQVSPQGVGYIRTPGIHSTEQVKGWRAVTQAVHRAGSKIFAQLWHVGRVSHPDFHDGALPVAPSALPVEGEAFTTRGRTKLVTPRALETDELPGIVATFSRRGRERQSRGVRRRGIARRQWLPARPVFCAMAPTGARTPTAAASKTAPAFPGSGRRGNRGLGPSACGLQDRAVFSGYSMSDSHPIETFSFIASD